ncbi:MULTISPECIES: hypothetical protein [unclassified Endozoicomonas]|uniref:hypothetical protein n=1 Tax=unclassified Endozoicomonas TaxID=2644528 RepID=UPI0021491CF1|nr:MULTISPECIES: hypothetical protein [unclassified Endozoicomonas]
MKKYWYSLVAIPQLVFAIGFEFPPYPKYDAMPQPHVFGRAITSCAIPAGTYRLDAQYMAKLYNISINKLMLKLHVNPGGLMVLTLQLKPDGREEYYLVNPYGNSEDLANLCNGYHFSFWFQNINLHGKRLSGEINGEFIAADHKNYLKVRGIVERYDPSWQSRVTIKLSNHRMSLAYPYVE